MVFMVTTKNQVGITLQADAFKYGIQNRSNAKYRTDTSKKCSDLRNVHTVRCSSVDTAATLGIGRPKGRSVDKKNQLDVTFCILYFSSNSCSTCFGQPCAHHQELTTA